MDSLQNFDLENVLIGAIELIGATVLRDLVSEKLRVDWLRLQPIKNWLFSIAILGKIELKTKLSVWLRVRFSEFVLDIGE